MLKGIVVLIKYIKVLQKYYFFAEIQIFFKVLVFG